MPRSMLKCFSTICIFLSFAIFVSFLDRVFNSFNSSRHKPVTKSTNDDEYGRIVPAKGGSPSHSIARDKKSILTGIANKLDINSLRENNNSSKTKLMGLEFQQSLDVFKRDWCRLQKARLDWKEILRPCLNLTVWSPIKPGFGVNQITDPSKSFISGWNIKAAGEFSRFVIQTVSAGNVEKTIGGDSWRIHIQGPSSLAPTIFDHNNGTYEVLFLIIEDGDYEAKIFLDYSLCHGFKDPPPYWFKKGNSQGKNQPDGILKGDRPYLIAPFRDGEKVTFHIPPSTNNLRYIDALVKVNYTCDASCRAMIWDGFGRWVNGQWKPYVKDIILKDNRNQEGIFFSFGDSVSNMFLSSLTSGPYRNLCKKTFIACRPIYHWVYDMAKYWGDGVKSPREPLPDDADYDHERVINDIKKTLFNPEITEKSVLMMNMGIHFAAAVNFTNYQRVIEQLIRLLKDDGENKPAKYISNSFKGRFLWKTSTAIHRERFPNPHKDVRRFMTFSRVKLFNAYALSAMCRAGIDVIDVHPISEAYPAGTVSQTDPVHYADNVFRDVEGLLFKMFSP